MMFFISKSACVVSVLFAVWFGVSGRYQEATFYLVLGILFDRMADYYLRQD